MGRWRTDTEQWLSSEPHETDEAQAAADAAFARVFTALPAVDPSPDFVERAVYGAWRMRTRRRAFATVAALIALALISASAGAVYSILGATSGTLWSPIASLATGSVVAAFSAIAAVAGWWWAIARAATTMTEILAMPQGALAFLAIECVGAVALYTLHRLLRSDVRFGNPGTLCV